MLYIKVVVFLDNAFKHGYSEEDFFEVLDNRPLKLRSRRGLDGIYELLGQTHTGEYLHIAYRREPEHDVVFHMRQMTANEKSRYRKR